MTPEDITARFMTTVLDADVASIATERIGDGLVGLNLRVRLVPPDPASVDSLPSSVVVKLPSLDPASRATGIALRNYEREVKFYATIADTVDIRVPTCHHGDWDEESGDFVLVLEDMAPAVQGDQVAGCAASRAELAVVELARLHGPRWDDPTLGEHEFLTRRTSSDDAHQLAVLWEMFLPGFRTTYSTYLDPHGEAVLDAFGPLLVDWVEGRTGPVTVTHGDYRLDNLLFGGDDGGPAVTAVDWQTPGHGVPVGDLAYFCGAGLVPDERRESEADLLAAYRRALEQYGVELDPSWLDAQYRREAFAGVIMAVVASQLVGGSERSESMFAAMASRHLQHCVDLDSIDAIAT